MEHPDGYDIHDSSEPSQALALLGRLDLPAGTELLPALRKVLTAGHRNHYRGPTAWATPQD